MFNKNARTSFFIDLRLSLKRWFCNYTQIAHSHILSSPKWNKFKLTFLTFAIKCIGYLIAIWFKNVAIYFWAIVLLWKSIFEVIRDFNQVKMSTNVFTLPYRRVIRIYFLFTISIYIMKFSCWEWTQSSTGRILTKTFTLKITCLSGRKKAVQTNCKPSLLLCGIIISN